MSPPSDRRKHRDGAAWKCETSNSSVFLNTVRPTPTIESRVGQAGWIQPTAAGQLREKVNNAENAKAYFTKSATLRADYPSRASTMGGVLYGKPPVPTPTLQKQPHAFANAAGGGVAVQEATAVPSPNIKRLGKVGVTGAGYDTVFATANATKEGPAPGERPPVRDSDGRPTTPHRYYAARGSVDGGWHARSREVVRD